MYDAEMKLNHQIVQFLEFQIQTLQENVQEQVTEPPELYTAILAVLAQYMTGLKSISCLLNHGFVAQSRGIFHTLGEDYEDIIFLSLPAMNGLMTNLHYAYLKRIAGEEEHAYYSPLSRCEIRSQIREASGINHNVFQLYPKRQALQVLRPVGDKPCSASLAIELHRHFAYKAILLTVLTAKVAGESEVMGECLNYRARLEMIDPQAVMMPQAQPPRRTQPVADRAENDISYAAIR
ncbi:hypothetical protein L4174_020790 [Photobacterium sp. CCB-ST2H9]|uniref:hypothetical protein n=1 Tax=unclassified Photobacterium TaxID=2628852 RepID=UPI0020032E9A|nr:hypothetical protein [Photobacterium sp. CCB-ST2H9]UTM59150.1 hypothetical protein L4174_020790 [Photobacterium sp. CCB-ST2H9]